MKKSLKSELSKSRIIQLRPITEKYVSSKSSNNIFRLTK